MGSAEGGACVCVSFLYTFRIVPPCVHFSQRKINLRYSLDETDASEPGGEFMEAILKGKSIVYCLKSHPGPSRAQPGPGPGPGQARANTGKPIKQKLLLRPANPFSKKAKRRRMCLWRCLS